MPAPLNDATLAYHQGHHASHQAPEAHAGHAASMHSGKEPSNGHAGHHGHDPRMMIADLRRRLWGCLVLTIPILFLSPMIQHWLGIADALAFSGSLWILFVLSSIVLL